MDVDCGRQTSGGRLNADKGEGQKLVKSCGHLLCMTPYQINRNNENSNILNFNNEFRC